MALNSQETLGDTFYKIIEDVVNIHGDKECVFDGSRRRTYKEVLDESFSLAKHCIALGLKPGDCVITCLPNWSEFLTIYAAVSACGAVIVPCIADIKGQAFAHIFKAANPKLVFIAFNEHYELLKGVCYDGIVIDIRLGSPACLHFEELVIDTPMVIDWQGPMRSMDVSMLLFTSGSTGIPKGVMLTASANAYVAKEIGLALKASSADVFFLPLTFGHIFGLCNGLLIPILHGARLVLCERYSPKKALDLIEQEKCTIYFGIPTMFIRDLAAYEKGEGALPTTLRTGLIGGSVAPPGLIKRYEERTSCRLLGSFGMTETTGGVTVVHFDQTAQARETTCGLPISGAQLRIVNEDGLELPAFFEGELEVKTPGMMKGYYVNYWDGSQASAQQEWFKTGDLGFLDNEGSLTISGRKKDIIIRGGLNINPREIENLYATNEAVEECQVVAYPDKELGERTCMVVKLAPPYANLPLSELRNFAYSKIEKHKVPDFIVAIDELPRLSNLKIDKTALRDVVNREVRRTNGRYV